MVVSHDLRRAVLQQWVVRVICVAALALFLSQLLPRCALPPALLPLSLWLAFPLTAGAAAGYRGQYIEPCFCTTTATVQGADL